MQFSYTFPPLLMLGYNIKTDAAGEDRPHIPGRGATGRIDTWRDWSRWKRVSVNSCFTWRLAVLTCACVCRGFLVDRGTANFLNSSICFSAWRVYLQRAWEHGQQVKPSKRRLRLRVGRLHSGAKRPSDHVHHT